MHIVWRVHWILLILCLKSFFFTVHSQVKFSSKTSLSHDILQRISSFKIDLHSILEETRVRNIRSVLPFNDKDFKSKAVFSITPETIESLKPYSISHWFYLNFNDEPTLLCGSKDGVVLLLLYKDNEFQLSSNFSTFYPIYQLQAFSYLNRLWVIVTHEMADAEMFLQVHSFDGISYKPYQHIKFSTKVIFGVTAHRNSYFLAVASAFVNYPQSGSMLSLYEWKLSQFDQISSVEMQEAKSLAMFEIDDSLFIAASMSKSPFHVLLYSYSIYQNKLIYYQYLETKLPSIVKHFSVGGQRYVIMTNVNSGIIYWWSGSQFLKWQKIDIFADKNTAISVSVLSVSTDEAIIALSQGKDVHFYSEDLSAHYVEVGKFSFDDEIASLDFWHITNIYLLPVFQNKSEATSIYKLQLTKIFPMSLELDTLRTCLLSLQSVVKQREDELLNASSKLDHIWVNNKTMNVEAAIIINGSITPSSLEVKKIYIKSKYFTELPTVKENMMQLYLQTNTTEKRFDEVVSKTKDQIINGSIHFTKNIHISGHSDVNDLKNVHFNGILIHKLINCLKKSGRQAVLSKWSIGYMNSKGMTGTVINGIKIEDFLLLKGVQSVKEEITFSNINVTNVSLADRSTLNGINLSELILTSNDKEITSLKNFSFISAKEINTHGFLNQLDMTKLKEQVVYIDNDGEIRSNLSCTSLIVGDNMDVTGDVSQIITDLVRNAVKRSKKALINGSKTFEAPVKVLQNLNLQSKLNDIVLNKDIVTIAGDQKILGVVKFSSVVFNKDLFPGLINNMNFKMTVVNRNAASNVTGRKLFLKPLSIALDINMTNNSLINGIDPGEISKLIYFTDEIIIQSEVVLNRAIVTNALKSADFPLLDLQTTAWSKKRDQEISVPVIFHDVTFENINVLSIQGNKIENFVPVKGEYEITASKTFSDEVQVHQFIKFEDGSVINGFLPFLSLHHMSYDMKGFQNILGNVTMQNVEIHKDLILSGNLNKKPISSIMKVSGTDISIGNKTFNAVTTSTLKANNIVVNFINSHHMLQFIDSVVKLKPARPVIHKTFKQKISGSSLAVNGFVDSCSIDDLKHKVVTLSGTGTILNKTLSDVSAFNVSINGSINGLLLSNVIDKLVFLDRKVIFNDSISFIGKVNLTSVNSINGINGVNIDDLSKNRMSVTKNNFMQEQVIFTNSIDLENMAIKNGASLDGVNLEDVIVFSAQEITNKSTFFDSPLNVKSIHVYGLINKCNLTKVVNNAFYLNKDSTQVAKKNMFFQSLTIKGNLIIKSEINDMAIDELNTFFAEILANHKLKSEFHFNSLVVETVNISGVLNNVSVNLFMKDAVRCTISQLIQGKKSISNMDTVNLIVPAVQLAGHLNGVNITDLNNTAVRKDTVQFIAKPAMGKINAYNCTIKNTLNKTKIPGDLILTYTDDIIDSETEISSSLVINSNLTVSGRIEQIYLPSFLTEVVRLNQNETIYSQLVFMDSVNVTGKIQLKTLNNIKPEAFVLLNRSAEIHGHKIFGTNLRIGNLVPNEGIFNNISIEDLSDHIITVTTGTKYINEMNFSTNLHVKNLEVTKINNLVISEIYETMHDYEYDIETQFVDLVLQSNENEEKLSELEEARKELTSDYAFLELQQNLNLGPTKRFLTVVKSVNISGVINIHTSHLIVWFENNSNCNSQESCCGYIDSLKMKVLENGTVVKERLYHGRMFYFISNKKLHGLKSVLVRSGPVYTDKKCTKNHAKVNVVTTFENGNKITRTVDYDDGSALLEVRRIEENDDLFLIMNGFNDGIIMYQYVWEENEWYILQKIPLLGPVSLDLITAGEAEQQILLSAAPNNCLAVYHWDSEDEKFLQVSNFSTPVFSSTLWVYNKDDLFIFCAQEKINIHKDNSWIETYPEPVFIYQFNEDNELMLFQILNIKGIYSFETFRLAGETYVIAVSRHFQTLYIIQWKGYSKFHVIQDMFMPGIESVSSYTIADNKMIAVASSTGHTKILRAVARGVIFTDDEL